MVGSAVGLSEGFDVGSVVGSFDGESVIGMGVGGLDGGSTTVGAVVVGSIGDAVGATVGGSSHVVSPAGSQAPLKS